MLADPGASAEELGKVGMVLAASPYKNHPDFMHLRAVLERRRGEPKRADVVFATAFRVYTESGSMLGSDSSFMADYIDNFRDIQDGAPKIQDAREGRPSLSAA